MRLLYSFNIDLTVKEELISLARELKLTTSDLINEILRSYSIGCTSDETNKNVLNLSNLKIIEIEERYNRLRLQDEKRMASKKKREEKLLVMEQKHKALEEKRKIAKEKRLKKSSDLIAKVESKFFPGSRMVDTDWEEIKRETGLKDF